MIRFGSLVSVLYYKHVFPAKYNHVLKFLISRVEIFYVVFVQDIILLKIMKL